MNVQSFNGFQPLAQAGFAVPAVPAPRTVGASGLLVPEAYNRFSTIASVLVFVALYACAWFTRDRIPTLSQPAENLKPFNFIDFFGDLARVLRNRNYLFLLLGLLFLSITIGMRAAFNNYMNLYYWEFTTSQIANFVIGSIIGDSEDTTTQRRQLAVNSASCAGRCELVAAKGDALDIQNDSSSIFVVGNQIKV